MVALGWTKDSSQGKWRMTQGWLRAAIDVCEVILMEEGWYGEEEGDFMQKKWRALAEQGSTSRLGRKDKVGFYGFKWGRRVV